MSLTAMLFSKARCECLYSYIEATWPYSVCLFLLVEILKVLNFHSQGSSLSFALPAMLTLENLKFAHCLTTAAACCLFAQHKTHKTATGLIVKNKRSV